jgi:di/tricarboxylate transporter
MGEDGSNEPKPGQWPLVILAWTLVGLPLLWGVLTTLRKAALLFK